MKNGNAVEIDVVVSFQVAERTPDGETKGRTPEICSQLEVASKFKCQNTRFNGTGCTKVYHISINIMREGARASEQPGETRQSETRFSRKGLVSLVAPAFAPLRKITYAPLGARSFCRKTFAL